MPTVISYLRISSAAWAVPTALILLALFPTQVTAQACCTATAFGENGVVGRCHRAVLSSEWSLSEYAWGFDGNGQVLQHRDRELRDLQWNLAGGIRFPYRALQIHVQLPLLYQVRRLDGNGSSETGIGDGLVGLRWTVLQDPMMGIHSQWGLSYRPFLDLALSLKAPTGRAPWESRDLSGADVTGSGTWQLMGGIKVSKFVVPQWAIVLGGFYGRSITHSGPEGMSFRPGDETQLIASLLHVRNFLWSGGGSLSMRSTGPASVADEEVSGSETRRVILGLQVTRVVKAPFWEVNVGMASDARWDGGGRGIPFAGPSISLGLRRAFL